MRLLASPSANVSVCPSVREWVVRVSIKLEEPLPRMDRCFFAEAIVFVVAVVRNVDFSHHVRLLY